MEASSLVQFTTPTTVLTGFSSFAPSVQDEVYFVGSKRNLKKLKKLPGKFKQLIKSKVELAKDLKHILGCLKHFEMADKEEKSEMLQEILADEAVNKFLVNIFVSLKESGLVNPIIEYSLTDDTVRAAIIDITIKLIEADVIPYREIFEALRDSGLALDVIKFLLTDPETRTGAIAFVVELLPELLEADIPFSFSIPGLVRTVTVCSVATTISTTTDTEAQPTKVLANAQTFLINSTSLI